MVKRVKFWIGAVFLLLVCAVAVLGITFGAMADGHQWWFGMAVSLGPLAALVCIVGAITWVIDGPHCDPGNIPTIYIDAEGGVSTAEECEARRTCDAAACLARYMLLPECRAAAVSCPACGETPETFTRKLLSRDVSSWPSRITNGFFEIADNEPGHTCRTRCSYGDEDYIEVWGPFNRDVLGVSCPCGAAVGFEKVLGE